MPTYVYETVPEGGGEPERFEVVQGMREEALTHHPETGVPVRRVPQRPYVGGEYSTTSENKKLSDENLGRLGFTKYVNNGGSFEKTVGDGPGTLKPD